MAMTVGVAGAPGENLVIAFAIGRPGAVRMVPVVLDEQGRGTATTPMP